MVYPPFIYQSQFNVVTSLLLSELVAAYPDNPTLIDMIDPFVKFQLLPVNNGYLQLPSDYRNILGSPYIFVNTNENAECGSIPEITTPQEFAAATQKGACKTAPLFIVPESEFTSRTNSKYKYPTHKKPIAYYSGQKQLKICPYDLSKVALLYARNEKQVNFTYILQPDDTYLFEPTNATLQDSEWTNSSFKPIFNAMCSLFSAYTRDNEMMEWSKILKEGIL